MADKMTKKEKFYMLRELVEDNEMLCEFIDHEIELLEKKASKPTKADKEKDRLTEIVYNALVELGEPKTISEIIASGLISELATDGLISSQKVSAYMKKLVDSDRVTKYTDKKKTYFKIAE